MFIHSFIENTWVFIGWLAIIFILTKFLFIRGYSLMKYFPGIFFLSLKNITKQEMNSAPHKSTRSYYGVSNKINILFYSVALIAVIMFVVFSF